MRPAIAQPVTASPVSDSAALVVLPIRLVVGWTFFSAFWRRVALADELDPTLMATSAKSSIHAKSIKRRTTSAQLPRNIGLREHNDFRRKCGLAVG
jgi:hypothetical protein